MLRSACKHSIICCGYRRGLRPHAGTPLLLHQEKTNPVDPNAVEVLSLHWCVSFYADCTGSHLSTAPSAVWHASRVVATIAIHLLRHRSLQRCPSDMRDKSHKLSCAAGHRLGYVPRGMTGSYAYEWGLAYVEGKGEAAGSGLTGVKVRHHLQASTLQGPASTRSCPMCLPVHVHSGVSSPSLAKLSLFKQNFSLQHAGRA